MNTTKIALLNGSQIVATIMAQWNEHLTHWEGGDIQGRQWAAWSIVGRDADGALLAASFKRMTGH